MGFELNTTEQAQLDKLADVLQKIKDEKPIDIDITDIKQSLHMLVTEGSNKDWNKYTDTILDVVILSRQHKLIVAPSKIEDTEYKLFCEDIRLLLLGSQVAISNDVSAETATDEAIGYDFLANMSDSIDLSKYLEGKLYKQDLNTLYSAMVTNVEAIEDEYNTNVLEDIRNGIVTNYANVMEKLDDLKKCYEYLYANTFSLYPYEGAITFFDKRGRVSDGDKTLGVSFSMAYMNPQNRGGDYRVEVDNNTSQKYDVLADRIQKIGEYGTDIEMNFSRTFDIDAILKSKKPLYFPYAVFGLATGAEFQKTQAQGSNPTKYKYRYAGCNAWKDYLKKIMVDIEDLFVKYVYKSIEYRSKVEGKDVKTDFKSQEFLEFYAERIDNLSIVYNNYAPVTYAGEVFADIDRFIQSLCCAVLITRNDDNGAYLKVRLSSFYNKFSQGSTKDLFDTPAFTQGKKDVMFTNGTSNEVKSNGVTVYEYSFCRDVTLMDKKPLMAYKAAQLFQKNGTQVTKDRILLGEDETGAPLFAAPEKGCINLTSTLCHRLSAGSRSGKGLITMSVLACKATDPNTAIFYVDRKPDMASIFAKISQGRMFTVNGGDMSGGDDVQGMYTDPDNPNSMLAKYYHSDKSKYKKYDYLTRGFSEPDFGSTYAGAFGDFVYAKAMIFTLGIIVARMHTIKAKEENNPVLNELLNMDGCVTVVLDEVTNWHHWFENKYMNTDGAQREAVKNSILYKFYDPTIGMEVGLDDANSENVMAMLDADKKLLLHSLETSYLEKKEAHLADPSNDKLRKEFESAYNKYKTEWEKHIKAKKDKDKGGSPSDVLCKLYWTTFFDKYKTMVDEFATIKNAGWNDQYAQTNDVFMIGQYITGCANDKEPIAFTKDKDKSVAVRGQAYADLPEGAGNACVDRTNSYMFGFAEVHANDWFTGRNLKDKDMDMSKYVQATAVDGDFGGKNQPADLANYLHVRGNWVYIYGGKQADYRGNSASSVPSVYTKLKPYLVFNEGDEPVSETTPYTAEEKAKHGSDKYRYIYGAASRVSFKDWEEIRKEHIDPEYKKTHPKSKCYGHLNKGLGLQGLIEEFKRTVDPACEFSPDWLAKSGDMANAICQKFGYTDYMDYLLDMSPKGIICWKDIYDVLVDPTLWHGNDPDADRRRLEKMFPRYANMNKLSLLSSDIKDSNEGTIDDLEYTEPILPEDDSLEYAESPDTSDTQPQTDSEGTYEDSYTEDPDTDEYFDTDDYEDSEPAYSGSHGSTSNTPVITDEERRQISDMVVEVVMSVVRDRLKAGVDIPDDEIHACVVNTREKLEQMILADKQRGADN